MQRIRILALVLGACFVSTACAQQLATALPVTRHLLHQMANHKLTTPAALANQRFHAQANPDNEKVWDLGAYPGGTWAKLFGISDFGVAVGAGDVAGDQRMIGVPLFGHNAGNWFESGISSGVVDELLPAISTTGMIAGTITGENGQPEAYAWVPGLAGYHLGRLPGDFISYAYAVNHPATFIVGQSFGYSQQGTIIGTAVVWTPRVGWANGKPALTWEIHALPSNGLEEPGAVFEGVTLRFWGGWGVNDYGQIAGDGYQYDPVLDEWWEIAVVWNPRKHGGGWELQRLPAAAGIVYTEALAINNLGEIVGDVWESNAFPARWKQDPRTHSWSVYVLPTTPALDYGWSIAWHINDRGDIVGYCTDENWLPQATRWNTHDLGSVKSLGFPGDVSHAFSVNNSGIAVGGYLNIVSYDENGNPIFGPEQAAAVRFP